VSGAYCQTFRIDTLDRRGCSIWLPRILWKIHIVDIWKW